MWLVWAIVAGFTVAVLGRSRFGERVISAAGSALGVVLALAIGLAFTALLALLLSAAR